ncbi:FMN-dependent NADH-azoreductase [Herbinix hemicellulosilytica]|uniref:FMN-dependent NADH-azoreductase n=1 Tax=Herbinix hemicellulosilytica TaxID=1564487 RepID=A0A0H5SY67_HERHM|nr:NAD(P)H-dependent oxidoreductase [Herbinix hemicellulosilytica]RBP59229.1 FMN-dependent NADH-azoreductase [Herbinix hemicellulosilytica]CRZ35328.1 FMN-dependent NADH-azoreductase [Herbinix hemicellulosilytica]
MRKLLYITVNSKPENLSSCKTVGRAFVNKFIEKYPEFTVEELDLYKAHIPRLEYQYFVKRNCIINGDALKDLDEKDQREVQKIVDLCNQFISAEVYVIASPMWSLSFPSPLKEYIDCIVQENRTIAFPDGGDKPVGLLNDKPRTVVYIQSSGAHIPFMLRPIMNKGLNYIEDIMKSMGISSFERLLVDGTGDTEKERIDAINRAMEKIDDIIERIEVRKAMYV